MGRCSEQTVARNRAEKTTAGDPLGCALWREVFVRSLEEKTGRCLELRGRGRPGRRDMGVSITGSAARFERFCVKHARAMVDCQNLHVVVPNSIDNPVASHDDFPDVLAVLFRHDPAQT